MNIKQIEQCIAERNIKGVENGWTEAVAGKASAGDLRSVVEALVASDMGESAETFVWSYLAEAKEGGNIDTVAFAASQLLVPLKGNDELRQLAVDIYTQKYGQQEHFAEFMKDSGLGGKQSFRRAVRTLDTCLAAMAGTYMANRFDEGVIRVKQYEPVMEYFELVDPSGKTLELEPKQLADEYECVDDNHFSVMRTFRKDELAAMVKNNIADLLSGICQARGGSINATDLKDLLVGSFVEKGKWSSWWSRARTASKKSDNLSIEGRNPATVTYYSGGRSLEDEFADLVKDARVPMDYLLMFRQYVQDVKRRGVEVQADFTGPIIEILNEQAQSYRRRRPVDAMVACLAMEEARTLGIEVRDDVISVADEFATMDDPAAAIAVLPDASLWPIALEGLNRCEGAVENFVKLLELLPAVQLGQVAKYLHDHDRVDALSKAVSEAMDNPMDNIQLSIWLWYYPSEFIEAMPPRIELFSRLMKIAEEIARSPEIGHETRRELFQQFRSAMISRNFASYRALLEDIDEGVAATVKRRTERCPCLSENQRDDMLGILRGEFYSLFLKAKIIPWLDDSVIWITQESIEHHQAELKELHDILLPANSRAIGAAAALGDLSENAEWQYAVEEQRRLNGRVAQVNDELLMARIIDPEDVATDFASIGSKVMLQAVDDGHQMEVNILGPAESDVANKVYNYRTPLALEILGKKMGDTVTLKVEGPEQDYTIVSLGVAL